MDNFGSTIALTCCDMSQHVTVAVPVRAVARRDLRACWRICRRSLWRHCYTCRSVGGSTYAQTQAPHLLRPNLKELLLGRGTALSVLWQAAHADTRLKRNDITGTSVKTSVDKILYPETPLALRLSGLLMLGLVRIYKHQLQYLHDDCQSTINKLEKADKQATKRATEKAGGRTSKANLHAKDADISMPDGPAQMFTFPALDASEEGFGLFDNHQTSSMEALADVEAQHSFQNIDAELFSQLGPEESMDLSSDGPERLRAVSEFSEDLGLELPPMEDMLPRMTPKKGAATSEVPSPHVSRDGSVNRGSLAATTLGNFKQDEMLPADLEMNDIDLPPILPPADEVVSQPDLQEEQITADDLEAGPAVHQDQVQEQADDVPPKDVPDLSQDLPMDELPPINPDVDEVMADIDPAPEPAPDTETHILEEEEQERAPRPVPRPSRKNQMTGQRLRRDAQSNKLSTDEPSSLREENLNPGMRVLLKGIGTCKPVSFFAFMGDSAGMEKESMCVDATHDEIEDGEEALRSAKVSNKRKGRHDAKEDLEQADPEDLRNAPATPHTEKGLETPHGGFDGDVPDELETRDQEHEVPADNAMPQDHMPPDDMPAAMDMDNPPTMDDEFPQHFEDAPAMPQPGIEDESMPGESQQQPPFVLRADVLSQGGANDMQEEVVGEPAMPASQPSQDASLNPHTILTLSKLQEMSQSQTGSSRKREREQHILMSSLTPPTCSRSEAAKCFYDVLVLQAKGSLRMSEQAVEYEDLKILLVDMEM